MGHHMGQEHILIWGLVGIAAQSLGTRAVRECLQRQEASGELLRWLAARLSDPEQFSFDRAAWVAGERAMALQVAGMSPDELMAAGMGGGREFGGPARAFLSSRAFRVLWPDRTLRQDFERYYDALEAVLAQPSWESVSALQEAQEDDFIRQHVKDWNILAGLLLPALGAANTNYVRAETQFAALRIDVALRLYRSERQAYPEKLEELVPGYLDELPVDPFSGKGFHYVRGDSAWTLYSVGPDQDDDGGREAEKWRGDGDLVYHSELKEEEE